MPSSGNRTVPSRIKWLRDELFATPDRLCFERARIVTASYQSTEGEHWALRRAKALATVFDDLPLFIRDGELIVGQRAAVLGGCSVYPEYFLNDSDRNEIPADIWDYWTGKTLDAESRSMHPERLVMAERELAAGYCTGTSTGFGHVIVDYEKALRCGFNGIIREAQSLLDDTSETDVEGRSFLEGVIISAQGIIRWAQRYAELADTLADETSDTVRAKELRTIASVCRRVPAEPARTFHEALQSFWFVHLAMHIEQYGWSISAGRFDQYMYPCFQNDLESGELTHDAAWELLLGLWIKFMENIGTGIRETVFQNLTLGGGDESGRDQSNQLSHMCLDATVALQVNQPAITVRWHPGIDPGFWQHVQETLAEGLGMPALFNDEVIVTSLQEHGVSRDDALDYAIVGCVEQAVPGSMMGLTSGGHINVAKALELALNEGRSMLSGELIGTVTPDSATFTGFADLWDAYTQQVEYLTGITVLASTIAATVQMRRGHCPLMSSLLNDCLVRRRDHVFGTRYDLPGVCIFGNSNTYDGLMAISRLVCDEKRITWEQLRTALLCDFEDHETLRQMLVNSTPRFGNGEPDVDELANRVNAIHADFCWSLSGPRNGSYTCGVWPVEGHVHSGYKTAATPDGRHKGTPLADGIGACHGADRNGPTALLRSVASLNHKDHWAAGNTCNIKFSKSSIATPSGHDRLSALTTAYMQMGGQQLQVNVVDVETLRAARVCMAFRPLATSTTPFCAHPKTHR
jgi:pyruvate formate-lyase/glycerol dehydratase family glycyl radical enzyme